MDNSVQTIRRKAFSGILALMGAMALMLFLPAGTLDFRQGWIYLLVFCGSSLLITLYLMKKDLELLRRRLVAGPAAEKEKTQQTIQHILRIVFIAILVVPGFDHRFGWSKMPTYLNVFGDVFVAIGFFIVFLVFRENSFTAATIEVASDQTVISTGPYARVRHPMYSGALLLLLFTPLALSSWWGLLPVVPMILGIGARLLDEEKFLKKNLEGYEAYCRQTTYRLVPGIW